jgi:hypothetical protein
MTANQPGSRPSSSVDLYSYSLSSTSTLPNAATITVPACTVLPSVSANIRYAENYEPPQVYVMFITDLSQTMKYRVRDDVLPGSGEKSRLAVAQASMDSAAASLYEKFGTNVHIGSIGFKGLAAGTCYNKTNTSCAVGTAAGDTTCSTLTPGDFCLDKTSQISSSAITYPFGDIYSYKLSDSTGVMTFADQPQMSSLESAINSMFVDKTGPTGCTSSPCQSTNIHGTRTYEGLVEARQMFKKINDLTTTDKTNTRYIGILLSDGEYTNTDPLTETSTWKDKYELYTVTIGTDTSFITQMNKWSTNSWDGTTTNVSTDNYNGVDYSFTASTDTELTGNTQLTGIYDQIVNNIQSISVKLVTANGTASTSVNTGNGVSLALPAGFACDKLHSQNVPIQVTFAGKGQMTISDVRVNYCAAP